MSGIIAVYGLVVAVLLAGQCKFVTIPFFILFIYLFIFPFGSITNRRLFLILVRKKDK